jgi:hypothetical protein
MTSLCLTPSGAGDGVRLARCSTDVLWAIGETTLEERWNQSIRHSVSERGSIPAAGPARGRVAL